MEVPTISRRLKKMAVTVRGTQSPWMATLGGVTWTKDPLLHAKQEGGKHRACVNCKSQEHNLLTVTRLNW